MLGSYTYVPLHQLRGVRIRNTLATKLVITLVNHNTLFERTEYAIAIGAFQFQMMRGSPTLLTRGPLSIKDIKQEELC